MTLHALPAQTTVNRRASPAPSPRPRIKSGRDLHDRVCGGCTDPECIAQYASLMAEVRLDAARQVAIRRAAPIAPKVREAAIGAFRVSFVIVMGVLLLGAAGVVPVAFPGSRWTQGLVAVLLLLGPASGALRSGYLAEHQTRPGDAEMAAERLAD